MPDLAVLVAKPDAEASIERLRAEGVYDDDRRVRERDDERVELPVLAAPAETDVLATVEQSDPDYRSRGLDDVLRERGWSEDDRERAPSSWAVVGDVLLADFTDCPRPGGVADALLTLHREADTVLDRGPIDGEFRTPNVTVLAGSGDTETVHTEHGTKYALDLSRVMFSPGNQHERARMGDLVTEGERVLDMFAGIGYFALPMARAGADVTAVEKNPNAFRYLAENAQLNEVSDSMNLVLGDCRDVETTADRVVLGYYDALDADYLAAAIDALVSGGTLHAHATVHENDLPETPRERVEAAARDADRTVESVEVRRVKSHAEGVWHVVADARLA
ncbi:class I SAM-dependent methyltransferase family protein [Salarchaeum sp. III]|uniref:class I SAM-dependent methyltransferase n=1 Tax=Salarchaeum sp. III TaxID=3107927 RepID=UPI002EDA63A0